jgi:hypothetical protein
VAPWTGELERAGCLLSVWMWVAIPSARSVFGAHSSFEQCCFNATKQRPQHLQVGLSSAARVTAQPACSLPPCLTFVADLSMRLVHACSRFPGRCMAQLLRVAAPSAASSSTAQSSTGRLLSVPFQTNVPQLLRVAPPPVEDSSAAVHHHYQRHSAEEKREAIELATATTASAAAAHLKIASSNIGRWAEQQRGDPHRFDSNATDRERHGGHPLALTLAGEERLAAFILDDDHQPTELEVRGLAVEIWRQEHAHEFHHQHGGQAAPADDREKEAFLASDDYFRDMLARHNISLPPAFPLAQHGLGEPAFASPPRSSVESSATMRPTPRSERSKCRRRTTMRRTRCADRISLWLRFVGPPFFPSCLPPPYSVTLLFFSYI